MRIRLVKEKVIQDFVVKHASSKSTFRIWLDVLKSADWESLEDMKATFPATDILGKGAKRVVFDIGGNGNVVPDKSRYRTWGSHRIRPIAGTIGLPGRHGLE